MELGKIKTTVRVKQGNEQIIRLFTPKQRRMIFEEVKNKPEHLTIEEVLSTFDLSPTVYYGWKKKFTKEIKLVKKTMEQKVITSSNVGGLNNQIRDLIEMGWKPVGSHSVVVTHVQNRFSGLQHKDSISSLEYSQTMIKE